jgi:GntR family transcriptional regulator
VSIAKTTLLCTRTLHDEQPSIRLVLPAEITANSRLAKTAKIRGGALQALAELGFPQRTFVDRISARAPTPNEVEALTCPMERQ